MQLNSQKLLVIFLIIRYLLLSPYRMEYSTWYNTTQLTEGFKSVMFYLFYGNIL